MAGWPGSPVATLAAGCWVLGASNRHNLKGDYCAAEHCRARQGGRIIGWWRATSPSLESSARPIQWQSSPSSPSSPVQSGSAQPISAQLSPNQTFSLGNVKCVRAISARPELAD